MRKCISVLLCCVLMSVLLIPGAYSLWRKDLNIMGTVEIVADKKRNGHGQEQGEGESSTKEAHVDQPAEANGAGYGDKLEETRGMAEVVGDEVAVRVAETAGTEEGAKTEVEKEEKAEDTEQEREN